MHSISRIVVIGAKFVFASFAVGFVMSWFDLTPSALLTALAGSPAEAFLAIWDGVMWVVPHIFAGAIIIVPLWGLAYLIRPPQM